MPREWTLLFFTTLLADVKRWCDGGVPHIAYNEPVSGLSKEDDGREAKLRLQYCIDTLHLPAVKALYQQQWEAQLPAGKCLPRLPIPANSFDYSADGDAAGAGGGGGVARGQSTEAK